MNMGPYNNRQDIRDALIFMKGGDAIDDSHPAPDHPATQSPLRVSAASHKDRRDGAAVSK